MIESISRTRTVLKGPLGTPVGYGEKSANVTLRKLFETYANIRPVRELPGVNTRYSGSGVDLVVVRENVEDLYAGIEHMQTPGVAQCVKLISHKGCEKIVRLAFEYARSEAVELEQERPTILRRRRMSGASPVSSCVGVSCVGPSCSRHGLLR